MSAVAKTTEVVTMGSVRPDYRKRGIPLDQATFQAHADVLARRFAREVHGLPLESDPSHFMRRVHLIGDATLLAVKVAQEHGSNFGAAVDRLRKIFVTGEHHDYENVLDPFTQEKLRVEAGITQVLGQSGIEIASSIAYLRDHPTYAELAMNILGALFSNVSHGKDVVVSLAIDLNKLTPVSTGRHDENLVTWRTLAKRTLPTRLRKNESPSSEIEQIQQAFYGALEGAIAASVIHKDGIYLSYRGSEKGGEKPITENMRTLTRAILLFALSRGELEKQVNVRFIIDPLLDGMGFVKEGQRAIPKPCDPHMLDSNNNGGEDAGALASRPPQKLPLLLFEDGAFRSVRPEELKALVVNDTGGIAPEKSAIVLHNVDPLGLFLTPERLASPEIHSVIQARGVSLSELSHWQDQVLRRRLERLETGKPPNYISPLIPGRDVNLLGDLAAVMGRKILATMEKS